MEPTSSNAAARTGGNGDCTRPDLAQRLSSGEELTGSFGLELDAHAKACSSCGMRLSLVRQAERWLADQASSNRPSARSSTPCPSAEELFDFGRGPGAQELPLAVERRMQAHLVECSECRGLVATLAMRPPAPLLDRSPDVGLPVTWVASPRPIRAPEASPSELSIRRPRPLPRWVSFAAAAAVIITALVVWDLRRGSLGAERPEVASTGVVFPTGPTLRGELAKPLLFPRTLVLAAQKDVQGADPLHFAGTAAGTWHPLKFEIAPVEGAEAYRIQLERAPKSVFGNKGAAPEIVAEILTTEPIVDLPADASLSAGKYVWKAWAIQNGLDHALESRNFEVVDDAEARRALSELARQPEPERSSAILRWLEEHAFGTEARAYARTLPPSPERDQYLATIPGR